MKTSINKLPEATEHMIQTQLIHWLKYHGYYVQRLNSGKYSVGEGRNKRFIMGQDAGTPDIMAFKSVDDECGDTCPHIAQTRLYFIEVKRSMKHKATALQIAKMSELIDYGADCFIASSIEDLEVHGL